MKSPHRVVACCLLAGCVAGCAIPATALLDAPHESAHTKRISMDRAQQAAAVGSTKADVTAALGEATVVRFETGYEVWVYRLTVDQARNQGDSRVPKKEQGKGTSGTLSEFVILFAPSGSVTKTRVRTAPNSG